MKKWSFGLYLAVYLGGILAACILVDQLVMPQEDVGRLSYHELLLAEIPSPRLIIESGSNSWYGVVPEMIEAAFGRPAIVVADYAGVPLDMKIHRLERYARKGDVIILPLEWEYYFKERHPSDFIENVVQDNLNSAAYYYDLNPLQRLHFIIKDMNLHYLIEGLQRRYSESHESRLQSKLKYVFEDMKRGLGGDVKRDSLRSLNVHGHTCREWLLVRGDTPLSSTVAWAADRLASLQTERGVKIYLTWPAVAGNDCYEESALKTLVSEIKELFGRAGIDVVGDPRNFVFPIDHVLDNYFHIDLAAAKERTARMIDDLRGAGLSPWSEPKAAVKDFAASAIAKIQTNVIENTLRPMRSGVFRASDSDFGQYFYLVPLGWSEQESFGIWSLGATSQIKFRRPPGDDCRLSVDGRYARPEMPSLVSVNGGPPRKLGGDAIAIPHAGELVTIELTHPDPKSPKQLGLSEDAREIAFGLQQIDVECGAIPVR